MCQLLSFYMKILYKHVEFIKYFIHIYAIL